jgi:hypothetical protein
MVKNELFEFQKEKVPIPKFLGRFSNNGLTTFLFSTALDLSGAAATFFLAPAPDFFVFLLITFG